jgi:hypothetical protein
VDADGGVILPFPGRRNADEFLDRLKETAKLVPPPVIGWDEANRFATRLLEAKEHEARHEFGSAFRAYRGVLEEDCAAPFHAAAKAGTTRIAAAARGALLNARRMAVAGAGTDTVLSALEKCVEQFESTPYAADLMAVRDRLAADGEFPPVAGID